jgi:4-hydroxy 2-oxovalerate aldolase
MKILDCTLRDGGYYTNWDFSRDLVNTYLESFNHLPVDYLELGYRSPQLEGYFGEYYYCPVHVLERIRDKSTKKLVIILNEKDVRAEMVPTLLGPCQGIISMVRIAIDPKYLGRSILLAEAVKKMGFEVGFNVMYMSKWKEDVHFLEELKLVNGVVDYFYMVDSYGGVYPEDVKEIYEMVRSNVEVPIGFHGHNNLELALINSLTAMECGATIIDATVLGMGRGAGNLKTELLFTTLNSRHGLELDFNALAAVTDAFSVLQKKYEWGTNLPYMVSGAHSLPQKEVMDWVGKRYYSINSILRALHNQKDKVKDNIQFPVLTVDRPKTKALLIGGGSSAVTDAEALKHFIEAQTDDFCIIHSSSKNALPFAGLPIDQYFCLVGNEGVRLLNLFDKMEEFNGVCVLPPFPRKMGTFVPEKVKKSTFELPLVEFTKIVKDSHTALSLQLALSLGVTECFVAGYDGYSSEQLGNKEQELFIENEALFADASKAGLHLTALTNTRYKNLDPQSIYAIV